MSQQQTVEGRLAFRCSLPSYAINSVAADVIRLLNELSEGRFDVTALDVSIVTKDSVATSYE